MVLIVILTNLYETRHENVIELAIGSLNNISHDSFHISLYAMTIRNIFYISDMFYINVACDCIKIL